jgi:hypothetical protein
VSPLVNLKNQETYHKDRNNNVTLSIKVSTIQMIDIQSEKFLNSLET